ncbi:MAG: transcription antitermination factor NusB [Phycisphaeraceae bacterium]|nr:transcription antitermination factor NusB [Phycisphaeraceae bacterium]
MMRPSEARDARRCAIQALFQFDLSGTDDMDLVRASLADSGASESAQSAGFDLARATWDDRASADAVIAPLTPEWPLHRQPAVDRNILRLAWHEMVSGHAPPKVVINEAVEIAREFSTDRSPLFINGVLDRIWKNMRRDAGEVVEDDDAPAIVEGVLNGAEPGGGEGSMPA